MYMYIHVGTFIQKEGVLTCVCKAKQDIYHKPRSYPSSVSLSCAKAY